MNPIHFGVKPGAGGEVARFGRSVMPRISPQRQLDRYEAIMAAARSVLATKGYDFAAIAEIARLADVSDGLIYRYFDGKQGLLIAVLDEFYHRVIDGLEAAVQGEQGFRPRFAALVRQHLSVFASDPALCRLFLTEVRTAADYVGSRIFQLNRQYTSILLRLIEEGVAEGAVRGDVDPRLIRDLLFGGLEHFAWRYIRADKAMDLSASQVLADTLLDGVCGVGR